MTSALESFGLMASAVEGLTVWSKLLLAVSALTSSYELFKDHRAPSVGFFLLGLSSGLSLLKPAWFSSLLNEAEWASEVLATSLVSFHLLWLSEDHHTALIILSGSCLLLANRDSFSAETLVVMTRCVGLSSLSCSVTVCLFAGSGLGALSSAALCIPSLFSARFTTATFGSLISTTSSGGMMALVTKLSLSFGCWTSTHALPKFLSDLTD